MSWPLFRRLWSAHRVRLTFVSLALIVWGLLPPLIYGRYGAQFKQIFESPIFPKEFVRLGAGDIFSLDGAIALSFIHPIAIILTSVFAVGFSTASIAGERQRGTLEVILARPLSRRCFYATTSAAAMTFISVTVASILVGCASGAAVAGVWDELAIRLLPTLWLNGVLLFGAFAAIGLAASASFDRLPPAMGVTLGAVIVMYVCEMLGTLWPAAEFLQPYSLFHYLRPRAILAGETNLLDFAVLIVVIAAGAVWALIVFPRRDLSAPI